MVKYYSKQEVMAYLKISLPTLNRYMKQGLKYHKVGRNVRFKMREINAFRKDKMKHYLTWEEVLQLNTKESYKVKLGNCVYEMILRDAVFQREINLYREDTLVSSLYISDETNVDYIYRNQFFNDLKLELVEE
jgi:excisionase family DNA binding protein